MISSVAVMVALVGVIVSTLTVLVLDLVEDVETQRAINRRLDSR